MTIDPEEALAGADEAVEYLKWLRPNGPWLLLAFKPDGPNGRDVPVEALTVHTGCEVHEFVLQHSGSSNCYYSLNPPKRPMNKKPRKTDILRTEFLHADLDPRANESAQAAPERLLKAVETFRHPPSATIISGNGVQALWRLRQAFEPKSPEEFEAVEVCNLALTLALGGTAGTQNADRILRLPGTLNIPNSTKRALGRQECKAVLHEINDKVYSLEDFDYLIPNWTSGDEKKDSDRPRQRQSNWIDYEHVIRHGVPTGQNRSAAFQGSVWYLANQRWTEDEIFDELLRYPNGIAEKYLEEGGEANLRRNVKRSYRKWENANPERVQRRELPRIQVRPGLGALAVDEAEAALVASNVPIFERGGRLVEPIVKERDAAGGRTALVTSFANLSEHKLAYLLNKRVAIFEHMDNRKRKLVEIDPPSLVTATLISLKQWKLPTVAGIIAAPSLRPDGSILSKPGYDPATRLWCAAHLDLPHIPEQPTKQQAEAALELLLELLSEFPFVTPVDRAVGLAGLMMPTLRAAFELAPMILVSAHEIANGKSYYVDVSSTIATGRAAPVITACKLVEEMEKRLGAVLLEAPPIVSLDNLSTDIEGDLLAQISTQKIIKIRILGRSEMPECDFRGTLFVTGNNISPVGDMVRRLLTSNFDAKVERPELRTFRSDPIASVLADRGKYVAAILTIARGYLAAGASRPRDLPPLASYGQWERFVRLPLIWLGQADPVSCMEQARNQDPQRAVASGILRHWRDHFGTGIPVKASELVTAAVGSSELRELLMEVAGFKDQIDPLRLGHWLKSISGRIFGGLRIDLVQAKKSSNHYALAAVGNGVEP
jgi:putative DNA primase/helicase